MPRRSVQQRAGFSAEAFVDKMVSDAGHIWNATVRDFGIDGQIEFVDAQEQVKGFAVAAQVKGTLVGFAGENRDACRFTCEADKIDYWLAYGRPVVLICVNLRARRRGGSASTHGSPIRSAAPAVWWSSTRPLTASTRMGSAPCPRSACPPGNRFPDSTAVSAWCRTCWR